MSCRATCLALPALFVLAGELALAQTSAPPAPPAGAKAPPDAALVGPAEDAIPILPLPPRPPDDPARAKRLAELRAKNDAEIAAQVAYGHQDEFLAAARERPGNYAVVKWMKVADGFVSTHSLQRYDAWNTAAEGRPAIRALDVELPGHPMNVLVDVDRELRSRGVDFLFVTFPTRAQLYPELMVPTLPAAGMRPFTLSSRRFVAKLLDAGVEVVDLGPLFFEQRFGANGDQDDLLFLRTNPHWTSRACELAARTVADLLLARGFAPGPAQEGRDFVVDRIQQEYRSLSDDAPDGAGTELIPVTRVRTTRGKHLDPEDDASPIAVMGDSFVRVHDGFESGFQRQLYRFLGRKIDAIAPEGGGDSASREMLRRRSADVAKKKIVIWLASEQIFRVGENWTPRRLFE